MRDHESQKWITAFSAAASTGYFSWSQCIFIVIIKHDSYFTRARPNTCTLIAVFVCTPNILLKADCYFLIAFEATVKWMANLFLSPRYPNLRRQQMTIFSRDDCTSFLNPRVNLTQGNPKNGNMSSVVFHNLFWVMHHCEGPRAFIKHVIVAFWYLQKWRS